MVRFHVLKFKLTFRDLWIVVVNAAKKIYRDDCLGLATQVSYHFSFSILPWLIFLTILVGYIGHHVNYPLSLSTLLTAILSPQQATMIQEKMSQIIKVNSGGLASFSAILMLWASSHVVNSLTNALDKAYGQQRKHAFLLNRLYSMLFILLSGLVALLCMFVVLFGPLIAKHVSHSLGLEQHHESLSLLWGLARWPLAFLVLSLLLALVYRFLPSKKHPLLLLWPGSMLAVLLWLSLSYLLGLYLSLSPTFSRLYGSLGLVVSILLWVHLSSFILLCGAEFNAALEARLKEKTS